MPEYRGPKLIKFNSDALMKLYAKRFYKEIAKPGVRAISFIVEREDGVNVQSSHRIDIDAAEIFARASHTLRGF